MKLQTSSNGLTLLAPTYDITMRLHHHFVTLVEHISRAAISWECGFAQSNSSEVFHTSVTSAWLTYQVYGTSSIGRSVIMGLFDRLHMGHTHAESAGMHDC